MVFDPLDKGTLVKAWSECLSTDLDRPLLYAEGRWITRGSFLQQTEVIASRLSAAGMNSLDRVLLSGPSSLELAVAYVACLRLGLTVVPVNASYTRTELTHLVKDCRPAAAIVDQEEWIDLLPELNPGLVVTDTSVDLPDGQNVLLDQVGPEAPALLVYTSGTTGTPKGALLTQANLLASAQSVCFAWRWTADDRLLLCLPLFHIHGLGVGLHGTLLVGGSAILQAGFEPDLVMDGLAEMSCTMFFGVPTMFHRLADHYRSSELRRLRLCVSGSAPLPVTLHNRLAKIGVNVLERYGMTETVMLVSNPYSGERRAGTVGFPLPGVHLRFDPIGEIQVRGPNVFSGYWENKEATASVFIDDLEGQTWFRTGDLGSADAEGRISINGRLKEVVITGGLNVFPGEVDDVIATHPSVAEVAVAGVPSEEWGEELVAYVVVVSGSECPTVGEIREFARHRLASYKLPRRVISLSTLPRSPLGKVLRHKLRETVSDG